MSLDRLQPHYGFSRLPFTRRIAPGQLYRSAGHQEAASRIGFLVEAQQIGVITGEVGVGKTVAARAAVAGLDTSRHTVIYLANPAVGARGLYQAITGALGAEPRGNTTDVREQSRGSHCLPGRDRVQKVYLGPKIGSWSGISLPASSPPPPMDLVGSLSEWGRG